MFHYYVRMDTFISFEDAMIQLRLTSSELHNLITTGKLQTVFRDGRIMFWQGDVDAYKQRLIPPPPLPEGPPAPLRQAQGGPRPVPQTKLIRKKRKAKKAARKPKAKSRKKKR